MVTGWLFPDRERCGISIYSRNYISVLEKYCTITHVNSDHWFNNPEKCSEELNKCDIIHIQYETSFFIKRNHDFYSAILRSLKKPVIVSLHEVYKYFPGVFPRDLIKGDIIMSSLKKWYYDYRHPIQTAYRKHLSTGFGSSVLLVHHQYQKEILEKTIPQNCRVIVVPMPAYKTKYDTLSGSTTKNCITLGTTGFINPEFDYSLLFKTLEQLNDNWQFFWIGGIRIPEHRNLLDEINEEIRSRHWSQKFIITGWVSEKTQNIFLESLDIYLAFFKNRSSSASLARAIGTRRIIVATDCQIVREMNDALNNNVISVVKADSITIAEKIATLSNDKKFIRKQHQAIDDYITKFNFDTMSLILMDLYKSIA